MIDERSQTTPAGANGQGKAVTLPSTPEVRRWIERTKQEREALLLRAAQVRERVEPLRKQLGGIERSIKVLDHFLAQVALDSEPMDAAPVRSNRGGARLKDRWSRKYAACLGCGTTERRHKAQGYCGPCYDGRGRFVAPESQNREG